jgi:hypothetical protein
MYRKLRWVVRYTIIGGFFGYLTKSPLPREPAIMTELTRRGALGLAAPMLPRKRASRPALKESSLGAVASQHLAGDNCQPNIYGGGTQAQAITKWQGITGRTVAVRRTYLHAPPSGGITSMVAGDYQIPLYQALYDAL